VLRPDAGPGCGLAAAGGVVVTGAEEDAAGRAPLVLTDLALCFEGAVPAVIATAAADGTPNVTYLSRVRIVDVERVALSNQFLSKTARNLAENPRASVLVIDPMTYDEYRLTLVYERTDRRGPQFDRLREDVEAIATLTGMQHVFKLRAADIYRVVDIEHLPARSRLAGDSGAPGSRRPAPSPVAVASLVGRLARCGDLDTLVGATVDGLHDLLGYEHSQLALLDERGERLFTIASHGYGAEGIGSEVVVGDGATGVAALRCSPVRIASLRQMGKYGRSVRRAYEDRGGIEAGGVIPLPDLADVESQLAVPAMALGQLVGVLTVESTEQVRFGPDDEAVLAVVGTVVANAIEAIRAGDTEPAPAAVAHETKAAAPTPPAPPTPTPADPAVLLRFFDSDGSVFLDSEYLIKGVAGRVLWWLVNQHASTGRTEFTNKEVRLTPELELPEFRDNLESRLILLKRRLEEREAPLRIDKTGRGRFRLVVLAPVRPEAAGV
jgi:adenylate cyclase